MSTGARYPPGFLRALLGWADLFWRPGSAQACCSRVAAMAPCPQPQASRCPQAVLQRRGGPITSESPHPPAPAPPPPAYRPCGLLRTASRPPVTRLRAASSSGAAGVSGSTRSFTWSIALSATFHAAA